MPNDNNLVLHDGTTITADITPTSTTRSSGSAVINLKKTPATGLYAVLIMGADLGASSDTLQVTIEHSASAGSGYEEVARFPLLTKGTGMPGTYIVRFGSNRMANGATAQYVRGKIDATDASGSDFTVANVWLNITPHAEIIGW
jgi:hypothetical protein